MKDERAFYNGRTSRREVWLERQMLGDRHIGWDVWELRFDFDDERPGLRNYPATDDGYLAALADYEARVQRRMKEDAR